jgi:hypothetical protein
VIFRVPLSTDAYSNRGIAYLYKGDNDRAIADGEGRNVFEVINIAGDQDKAFAERPYYQNSIPQPFRVILFQTAQ